MDLEETRLDTTLVYEGSFMQVRKDNVRMPNGATGSREYITHPGAVAVLAILDNGNLVVERQFRYAPQREFIELPAGKIDHGEDILLTAQRELLEETGYAASEWRHLTTAWACIGYADERIEFFLERVLGRLSPKRISSGLAIGPISLLTQLRRVSAISLILAGSSGRAPFSTTKAVTASPFISCGLPTTAASATSGLAASADSISIVPRRWPETFSTSSMRPMIQKYPSSSRCAESPAR